VSLGKKIAKTQMAAAQVQKANNELIHWYKLERRWRLRMTVWASLAVAGWGLTVFLMWKAKG
jgi:hypothetical protein